MTDLQICSSVYLLINYHLFNVLNITNTMKAQRKISHAFEDFS